MLHLLVLPLLLTVCGAQYTVPVPNISLLEPTGLRFKIADEPGVELVAYHYNINKPLPGVGAGDYNVVVNSPTGGYWEHTNTKVNVNPGDIVYYWIYVLHVGLGYQITDLSWVADSDGTTTAFGTTDGTSTAMGTTDGTTFTMVTTDSTTFTMGTTDGTSTAMGTTDGTTFTMVTTDSTTFTMGTKDGTTTAMGSTDSTTFEMGTTDGTTTRQPEGPCTSYPCGAECDMSVPPCNGLIFEDTFDYLDFDTWEHEITAGGGGNWEFQYYTNNRTNSYVRGGKLYLKPTLTEDTYGDGFISSGTLSLWGASPANLCTGNAWWGCGRTGTHDNYINTIQSARIRTVNSFGFTFGKVEVSAKLPVGDWIWPAIWLLPTHNGYGDWPASGEIDLMESRGNLHYEDGGGESVGVDSVGQTLHWGPFFPYNRYELTTGSKVLPSGTFGDAFHKFTVEWTPDNIIFYIDDEMIHTVDPGPGGFYDFGNFARDIPNTNNPWENSPNKMAPWDQEFHLIMNVAVGGTGGYFHDSLQNQDYPKPWSDSSSTAARDFWDKKDLWYPTWNPTVDNGEGAAMKIDYVRVWAHGSY